MTQEMDLKLAGVVLGLWNGAVTFGGWRGSGPWRGECPPVLEKKTRAAVSSPATFAWEKMDFCFRCVVSIEAELNLLSEDYKATAFI